MFKKLPRFAVEQVGLFGLLFAFVLPFGIVVQQLVTEINQGIEFAQKEIMGLQYSTPLRKLLEQFIHYQILAEAYTKGDREAALRDRTLQSQLESQHSKIAQTIQTINQLELSLGDTLDTTSLWMDLEEEWQENQTKVFNSTPAESREHHLQMISQLLELIAHVGDTSNLILDPQLDSYYLMDGVVNQLPDAIANTAKIRDSSAELEQPQPLSLEQKSQLIVTSNAIEVAINAIRRGIRVAFEANPKLQLQLKARAQNTISRSHLLLDFVENRIQAQEIPVVPEYKQLASIALTTQFQLYDTLAISLNQLLQQRIDQFTQKKRFIQFFAGAIFIVIFYLAWIFSKNLQQRRQAEINLRNAEIKYRSIFENSVAGIFQTSPDGKYLSANPALARLYGYDSPEELMTGISSIQRQLYVDPTRRQEFIRLLQEDEVIADFESQIYRRNHQVIWISETAYAIKDDQGRLLYYEGSVIDVTSKKVALEALRYQQEQSEKLLLNILPEPIAQRLKQDDGSIAETFEEVSVLFADIVGFTQLSEQLSPQDLVHLLNQIFSTFDYLAEKHRLEKIKTIGDAYMAVSGLPLPQENHAEAIADMALEIQTAMKTFSLTYHHALEMRIGINSGSVVAGVIGVKKFIYDLWGDTVNLANRMESSGIAGTIQVTEATYQRLRDSYLFEKREKVYIKGKGEMSTYILLGKKLPEIVPYKLIES